MRKKRRSNDKSWTIEQLGSLDGKTYVITGTTSGIGLEAARIFLSKGANVVMLNRNAEKSFVIIQQFKEEFGNEVNIDFVPMDLASLVSVRHAAAEVLEKVSRIDALLCNAAIAQVPQRVLTVDGFESHLGVNYFANFLLCGLLFERIEQSKGRIVVVSSLAYKGGLKRIQFEDLHFEKTYSGWNAYAQSKLALMMFAYELQRRIQDAGKQTKVYVCHPGASRTHLERSFGWRDRILWGILKWFVAQPAERGAWPEIMCATKGGLKEKAIYGPTRRAETVGPVGEGTLDPIALDQKAARQLWKISEEATGLHWEI